MNKLVVLAAAIAICATGKEFHQTFPMGHDGHVHIDTFKGEVRVTSWDQPSVEVNARIEPDGASTHELEAVDKTEIRVDSSSGSLHIKSDYKMVRQHNNTNLPFVRYEIKMPRTARLEIKDYKSEIEVSDLTAPVEIETYKGDTRVRNLSGTLRMNSYKGHGNLEFSKFAGPSSIETYKGSFDVAMPQNAGFELVSKNGFRSSVRSSFPFTLPAGTYIRADRHGDGHFQAQVNGGGPELVLKSYRGEFNLH
jgi:Putative adhesin